MPACRQCGKHNPEGTVFCGYCAASLAPAKPAATPSPIPPVDPSSPASIQMHEIRQQAPPKIFKPESRVQPAPPADGARRGGIEWLPWSKLSGSQKAGRALAGALALLLIFFFMRGILRGMVPSSRSAPQQQGSMDAMTDGDRRDGIESLCKVFQIYGLPRSEQDAAESAKNASELFKLAGNQSPERSMFILTAIAGEFRSGKLKEEDCAEAGEPLPTATAHTDAPAEPGDRIGGIPLPPANAPNSGPTR